MLKSLLIKNYAIIDALEVNFNNQLNIITGETGAGKSILLGALNMILGKRADTSTIRNKKTKSIIEGTFDVQNLNLKDFFLEFDLDYENETTIRREIKADGKSRAFVNDSPVTLDVLKQLTSQLVDLHEQHETQSILDHHFYLNILDYIAEQQKSVTDFRKDFEVYQAKKKELAERIQKQTTQSSDLEYLQFQFDELDNAQLNIDIDENIESELKKLENAETITENLGEAINLLSEDEVNIMALWNELTSRIQKLSRLDNSLQALEEQLNQVEIELEDINRSISQALDDTYMDDEQLATLSERQNLLNRLMQKHKVNTVSELIDLREQLNTQISDLENHDIATEQLEKEVASLQTALYKTAQTIAKKRAAKVKNFTTAVEQTLTKIGMPYAKISFDHQKLSVEDMNAYGIDKYELLFTANKGSNALPLKKVASGGERSRLMLAIKSIVANNMALPTMIFDEIDTGISGEVAAYVGDLFVELAKHHQIISITHLPQIAAKAHQHLFVYKDHSTDTTQTKIKTLSNEEQLEEIAKMLSGKNPNKAALEAAKELVN